MFKNPNYKCSNVTAFFSVINISEKNSNCKKKSNKVFIIRKNGEQKMRNNNSRKICETLQVIGRFYEKNHIEIK